MLTELSVKQEFIVEAALKRFSHFGIGKTTLSEIANDLKISKPLLFYYFDDKESLVVAVFQKLVTEFLESLEQKLLTAASVEEGFEIYVDEKHASFKKHLQLAMQADGIELCRYSSILKPVAQVQSKTTSMIVELMEAGISKQELRPMDTPKTAKIILETLRAFEGSFKLKNPIPAQKDLQDLMVKQKKVIHLFLYGLKKNSTN